MTRPISSLALTRALAAALISPVGGVALAQTPPTAEARLAPPVAEGRMRVDTLHGELRRDEYFWLRNKSDPAVRQYLESENAYAAQMLAPLKPLQDELYREMLSRIKQTDLSVPYRRDGYFYYTRTIEGQQYPVYARKRGSLEAPEQVTLDVNALARGQTFMSVGAYTPSDNGNLLAFSTDSSGYRQYMLQVKDLRTGAMLPDRAARATSTAWAADNRTLFYTVEDSTTKRSHRLYRHVVGSRAHDLLYEEKDERFSVYIGRTLSKAYLVMSIGSLTTSEIRLLPANAPMAAWKTVAPRVADHEYDIEPWGPAVHRDERQGPQLQARYGSRC